MERIIKIEATGSALMNYFGYVKEKDVEKVLKMLRSQYMQLEKRHGRQGTLKVKTEVYNPELPLKAASFL